VHADLELAHALVDLADAITLPRFRAADLRVETKPDLTPVSDADRAVERAIRERLERERPGEPVHGEEEGGAAAPAPVRWILDPIDGTKSYVRGIPVYATLLALERDGEVVLGVVSAPALGRRWWAARGEGAFANGQPIRVSRVARLEDAVVSTTSPKSFYVRSLGGSFEAVATRAWAARGFSDFWQHMLVAEGSVDAAFECVVELWDVAAVQVIVEEAGGRFTDLRGERTPAGGTCVTSNGLVHDELLEAFASA
jgi:histidinol-phosphatase